MRAQGQTHGFKTVECLKANHGVAGWGIDIAPRLNSIGDFQGWQHVRDIAPEDMAEHRRPNADAKPSLQAQITGTLAAAGKSMTTEAVRKAVRGNAQKVRDELRTLEAEGLVSAAQDGKAILWSL